MTKEYKMVILVDKDLKIPAGKLAGQVAHAAIGCMLKEQKAWRNLRITRWFNAGQKKVVLRMNHDFDVETIGLTAICSKKKISFAIIEDMAKTVFKKPTRTCVAVGLLPDDDPIFKDYKLY